MLTCSIDVALCLLWSSYTEHNLANIGHNQQSSPNPQASILEVVGIRLRCPSSKPYSALPAREHCSQTEMQCPCSSQGGERSHSVGTSYRILSWTCCCPVTTMGFFRASSLCHFGTWYVKEAFIPVLLTFHFHWHEWQDCGCPPGSGTPSSLIIADLGVLITAESKPHWTNGHDFWVDMPTSIAGPSPMSPVE